MHAKSVSYINAGTSAFHLCLLELVKKPQHACTFIASSVPNISGLGTIIIVSDSTSGHLPRVAEIVVSPHHDAR